jgi:hypothetical protein
MIEMAAAALAPTSLVAGALQVLIIAVAFAKPSFTSATAVAAVAKFAAHASSATVAAK